MKEHIFIVLLGSSLSVPRAHAQRIVTGPGNFAGNIVSSVKETAIVSKTAKNILDGFKEMEKLYNGTEKYYDALKKINNLIDDAYKVKECILMMGDILEIYIILYKKALSDRNFRPSGLAAMASGYIKLLERSGGSLKELKPTVKNSALSMSDHERMQQIDRIYTTLCEYRSLVLYYTRKSISVSYAHAREENSLVSARVLYGNTTNRYW